MPSPRSDRRPRARVRHHLRRLILLIRDPARWSAEWYAEKRSMDYVALHPESWRRRE